MRLNPGMAVLGVAALALAAVGCGDEQPNASNAGSNTGALAGRHQEPATVAAPAPAPAPAPAAAKNGALTIKMSEFKFDPKDASATAGKLKISAPNEGKAVHELVLLKTDADPAKLPTKGGKIDESTSVGEIADVEPGATKSNDFDLKPGKYVMVCALPGHYEGGMYGSITVK